MGGWYSIIALRKRVCACVCFFLLRYGYAELLLKWLLSCTLVGGWCLSPRR